MIGTQSYIIAQVGLHRCHKALFFPLCPFLFLVEAKFGTSNKLGYTSVCLNKMEDEKHAIMTRMIFNAYALILKPQQNEGIWEGNFLLHCFAELAEQLRADMP